MNMIFPRTVAISSEQDVEFAYYDQLHQEKYRDQNQTKFVHMATIASKLKSNTDHEIKLFDGISNSRFLPAGRIQAALGATEREVSPFNCSVSQRIDDSMDSIMAAVSNAAKILRLGTGIGYNFSNLRPFGAEIKKLRTNSSGPLSFMKIFDVMASTIASSGHRRGAQMGIMNVDHPDIEAFIDAKLQKDAYRQFNLSVGISDKFIAAVAKGEPWPLVFDGKVYRTVNANALWEKIIRNAYNSAEPGLIFIDRLNDQNNLHYCEQIEATNPCAEQPLPPYGLCTLGSFNLVGYIKNRSFDYDLFKQDIHSWVEAYDNIFDSAVYAIPEHREEAISKRRIGLGFTGIANAIEYLCGKPNYGEPEFCTHLEKMCKTLRDEAYDASCELAKKRGAFRLYDGRYNESRFIKSLPNALQAKISKHGIRNSHIISYAPCGTISQTAGNISSGVEPVFYYTQSRDVYMKEGKINVTLQDYNYRTHGFEGKTLEKCSVDDHMSVANIVQQYCDSAVSKTVNVRSSCTYPEYERIYKEAHRLGLKGVTVYRPNDLRGVVIKESKKEDKLTGSVDLSNLHCANGMCSL